ncbi:MAG: saccharopine dehydrogenase family protein, partial [Cyclobacteriaceae bacterium]
VFDIVEKQFNGKIDFVKINFLNENSNEALQPFDLVITAVPGHSGFKVLKKVIDAGKNVVDISFFPEDPFILDKMARAKGVTAIVDCGLAPGLGNLVLGYHHARMQVNSFRCYVAGLPVERTWPFAYKAVFSPVDVIEEYTRPARVVENGKIIIKEALSELEMIEIPGLGTLEAFNTDGLRTLLYTVKIPELLEKTMRYPGSTQYLQMLKKSGFFSADELNCNGTTIRPIDLTSQILFKQWQVKPGDEDISVLVIKLNGEENEKRVNYHYFMTDRYDHLNSTLSMARTTGYTCTAAANLLLEKGFAKPGICPPELIGADAEAFHYILNYLKNRNINFKIDQFDES